MLWLKQIVNTICDQLIFTNRIVEIIIHDSQQHT